MADVEEVENVFRVDYDRGVTKRSHDGIQICMYKDDPGFYFDILGNEIKKETAKLAGFPVDELAAEKEKTIKLKKAQLEIEKEYGTVADEVIHESDDYEVVCVNESKKQYNVRNKASQAIANEHPMDKKRCIKLANSLK